MPRFAFPLAAVALLAACAEEPVSPPVRSSLTSQPVVVAPPGQPVVVPPAAASAPSAIVVQPSATPYRPGFGIVQAIALVANPSAAAGGGAASRGVYRLTVRMDDGTVQVLDQDSRAYMVGDRIQLSADGQVVRP